MSIVTNKKKFQTVIIHKALTGDYDPTLSIIREESGFHNLKRGDIIEITEFRDSWHVLIRREKIYRYEY